MTRLRKAWAGLAAEQRLAAVLSSALFLTMFLPWYTRDTTAVVRGRLQTVDKTLIAWSSFSFVEAAILLVAVGVLVLLFLRGERRAFHLPGGDGTVILGAGTWVALLVFYRLLDNRDGATSAFEKVDYGVSWGIFVTLLCGVALAYAGNRLRAAHVSEPPLPQAADPAGPRERARSRTRDPERARPGAAERPDQARTTVAPPPAATSIAPRPARPEIDGGEQLSFDEQE